MRDRTEVDRCTDRPETPAYEPPAIAWEEELPQGPNLFAACGKVGGGGEPCNTFPAS